MAVLKFKSKGVEVKKLQQNLKDLGYTIAVDGDFGNGTKSVVIRFQKDNNLSPDGIVGSNTQSVIDFLLAENPIYGIDISHHNGAINFNKINWEIIKFVFCKASQGKTFKDNMLHSYFSELKRLNIFRGVYHFMTFKDVSASNQVNNFLNCGVDFSEKGVLPPVLDLEWQQSPALNNYIMQNKSTCIQKAKDWLTKVEAATGRIPIIYTANSFWRDYFAASADFSRYPLWLASYNRNSPVIPTGWTDYKIWQFTEGGTIEGLVGNVDKNVFNGSMNDLKKLANF